jgi:hypothetical protein
MRCYSHLSDHEREQIWSSKALGHSTGAIAQAIGRPKTDWRELSRNRLPSGRYSPLHAAGAHELRRRHEARLERDEPYGSSLSTGSPKGCQQQRETDPVGNSNLTQPPRVIPHRDRHRCHLHVPAGGPDRDPEPARSFGTFTGDLHRLADRFEQCGVSTVAMESTGVYWIPVFEILEQRGFTVLLMNARDAKRVPGRNTDVTTHNGCSVCTSMGCAYSRTVVS